MKKVMKKYVEPQRRKVRKVQETKQVLSKTGIRF